MSWRPRSSARLTGCPRFVLGPTADILAELGRRRRPGQVLVGFAAETDTSRSGRPAKLEAKGVDLMVANDVGAEGVGFGHETNAVTISAPRWCPHRVPLQSKRDVAEAVLRAAIGVVGGAEPRGVRASRAHEVPVPRCGDGRARRSPPGVAGRDRNEEPER